MSDFDEEAERERLREKYGEDSEDREQTQRMSQLLLRGATMTNKHCDRCGTPVFRYEDEQFCPECQADAAEGAAAAAADEGPEAAAAAVEESADPDGDTGSGRPRQPAGTDPADNAPDADRHVTGAGTGSGADAAGTGVPSGTAGVDAAGGDTTGDLGEARASLVRTLTALAQRAEAADTPRQAQELLAAAREAAETIDALDQ